MTQILNTQVTARLELEKIEDYYELTIKKGRTTTRVVIFEAEAQELINNINLLPKKSNNEKNS